MLTRSGATYGVVLGGKCTCLDGNLHRDDLALRNILGDHRTVPGSFTRSLRSEKITSCFPKHPVKPSTLLCDAGLTGKMLEAILGNELFTLCALAYKTFSASPPLFLSLVFPGRTCTRSTENKDDSDLVGIKDGRVRETDSRRVGV